ncbi:MAG TPA: 7-cyano-7-deazaguanine synthase QueC [Phycisphaerales bacterium]|nr:7-cyano-7-deazaguanine synthase QueC [Phycisphaerales bacterium]
MSSPAVVLLSGGLDSATVLAVAKSQGFTCHALTFDYGQRHKCELHAARAVAKSLGVTNHVFMTIDLRAFGGSALTADIPVPKDRANIRSSSDSPSLSERGRGGGSDSQALRTDESLNQNEGGIPITYVPARNTIFLSFALAFAETLNAPDIFIGVNAIDYSGYPDCRPEYVSAFEHMANLATRMTTQGRSLKIHTPLINLSKADIIRTGTKLGVDYALTISCYDPSPEGKPCGHCDACLLRAAGFRAAGLPDPALNSETR